MGSGSSQPTTTTVNQNTSSLPAYAQPYFMGLMNSAQAYTDPTKPPPVYGQDATGAPTKAPYDWATPGQRIAGFTQQQQGVQNNILNQQMPGQFQQGSGLAAAAGLGALGASQYGPSAFASQQIGQPNLQQYSMQQPGNVQGAQTGYNPNLNYFQMQGPGSFGSTRASQYMSPYMQSVVDVQKNEAIRDAQKGQLAQNLGAARQGTYGGARQLLAQTENQRNLNTQLGNIQAQGQQAAFQNAQQQFNTEQAAQQQAGQQNLNAALGVQQLGANIGTQTALANLSNEQQAALANQQAGLTTGQQNLNAALQTQQLGTQTGMQALLANQQNSLAAQQAAEQSRQFGANLGLQGLAQANQSAQTLGNLGATQQQTQSALLNQQQGAAAQQQALQQQYLDTAYQDYQNQLNFPMQQLQQYSSLLHGVPVAPNTTATIQQPSPSVASQLLGTGLAGLSAYNMVKGG